METENNNNLIEYLKRSDVFDNLLESTLRTLADNASCIKINKGETLFKKGDTADAMFVVKSGALTVLLVKENGKDVEIGTISAGEIVGEIQFLTGGKRTATIRAKEDAELIKLHKTIFDTIQSDLSVFFQRINGIIQYRLRHGQLSVILPKLFGSLTSDEIKAIENKAECLSIRRGEELFRQGEQTNAFYILLNGILGVSIIDENGNNKIVNQVNRGESVGEISLITDDVHSATVYAMRNSELVRFSKSEFIGLLETYPKLSLQIMQMIVSRLHKSQRAAKKEKSGVVIAIVPASPETDLKEFISRLTACLSDHGPLLHVNSDKLDNYLETPGISQISEDNPNKIRVSAWFNLQEEKHRFIICETDKFASNWTKQCLSFTEHVIIVGNAASATDLGEIESELMYREHENLSMQHTLILLHPNSQKKPKGTRKWLEKRPVTMHHHVRMDNDVDFQRVARFLAKNEIGLALSGGGARSAAQSGAIGAFEEAGIPIDIIGGVSMGALIGATYAMGWTYKTMVEKSELNALDMVFDLTLPISSLLSGKKLVKTLKQFFGDTQIEDLWLPYFCVSSNLTRAEVKVHRMGSLWEALYASNAAPGIFPPALLNKELYVDGSLLSNLPAKEMKELCAGSVVGIDVAPPVDLEKNILYENGISGWQILWRKINPFAKTIAIPDIATILRRAGELSSVSNRKQVIEKNIDLYLSLPVQEYKVQDYKLAKQIIEVGYAYTKQKMKKNRFLEKLTRNQSIENINFKTKMTKNRF